jgi:hypothetical protein
MADHPQTATPASVRSRSSSRLIIIMKKKLLYIVGVFLLAVATTVVLLVTVGPFDPKSSKSDKATVLTTTPSSQPTDKIAVVTASPSFQPIGSTASPSSEPTGDPSFKPTGSSQSTGKPSTLLDWYQKGMDIDGEAAEDASGTSVSLSDDGTVLAIGATGNSDNGYYSGHVRVYEWNAGTSDWDQRGDDIDGEAAGDHSGWSVSLSSDGSVLAIGARDNSGANGYYSGHVRVYEWNAGTSSWEQKGSDIDGEAAYDGSGRSVSLSSDGTVLAIGAQGNCGNGESSGHVRVYEWDAGTSDWVQKGTDIDGEAAGDESGYSVSLSSDGLVLAIGAIRNDGGGTESGHVRVYEWNTNTAPPSWQQKGDDIDGEAAGDTSGRSVSLSSDGTILAIGAVRRDESGTEFGYVRVYEWTNTGWQQRGDNMDGETAYDLSGWAVVLSGDGNVVAIGAPHNNDNGRISGHVRVYDWKADTSPPSWQQRGADIDGEAAEDESGESVSLSSDGLVLAIGARGNDDNGYYSGHVRVYEYTN